MGPLLFLVTGTAFAALWLLMRGAPRSPQFVRTAELSTLFIGTAAFSGMGTGDEHAGDADVFVRTLLTQANANLLSQLSEKTMVAAI